MVEDGDDPDWSQRCGWSDTGSRPGGYNMAGCTAVAATPTLLHKYCHNRQCTKLLLTIKQLYPQGYYMMGYLYHPV